MQRKEGSAGLVAWLVFRLRKLVSLGSKCTILVPLQRFDAISAHLTDLCGKGGGKAGGGGVH